MKNKRFRIFPVIVALTAALAVGVSTGCAGIAGGLGIAGCLGSSLINAAHNIVIDNIPDDTGDVDILPWTDTEPSEDESGSETKPESETQPASQGTPVYRVDTPSHYEEYDPEEFYALCDELARLGAGNDADAVIAQYEKVYDLYLHYDEMGTALSIEYDMDPTDEYWSEQYKKVSSYEVECSDAVYTAVKAVCSGPCADRFREYIGEDYFDEFASYEELTDEESEIYDRIAELTDQYYTEIEKADASGIDDEELNSIIGPIFVEMVNLRNRIAQIHGYDEYSGYADELVYLRDFDEDDIENFHKAVKKISARAYDLVYNSTAYSAPYYIDIDMTTEELLDMLKTYGSKISPYAKEAAELLIDEKLYSIGNEETRIDGAYTTDFAESGVPFIFANAEDSSAFVTLSHEFGHFTDYVLNPRTNVIVESLGALELCEIHSNGLQGLFSKYYDKIFGERYAQAMEAYVVIDLITNITEGCLYDEFQRRVYREENLTVDKVNEIYHELNEEYGVPSASDDYWWIYVSHNFEAPFYYLSYAASGFVALQIWEMSKTDYDKAVKMWESIVEAGAYDHTYMELLESLDITTFRDSAAVGVYCDQALSFVESAVGYSGYNYNFNIPDNISDYGDLEDWLKDFMDQFGGFMDGFGGK